MAGDDTAKSPEQAAFDRVEALRRMVIERRRSGQSATESPPVSRAAWTLLQEAKTNPDIATAINATTDKETRGILLAARERDRARSAPITSRAAYVAAAARIVRDISDPSRRAQAGDVLNRLSSGLGVPRSQARERDREQDIEAGY